MPAIVLMLGIIMVSVPAIAHSWYQGLEDREGRACCDEQDCRPVRTCQRHDDKLGLLLDGHCIAIPWNRVLDIASPDDRAHACWVRLLLVPHPVVRCVILPSEV